VTDRNPYSWLPGFASRIAPDFFPNQYHVPAGGGSTKFGCFADVFTMGEFEEALNQCNNCTGARWNKIHYVQILALRSEAISAWNFQ
jgi:hypothetical protein